MNVYLVKRLRVPPGDKAKHASLIDEAIARGKSKREAQKAAQRPHWAHWYIRWTDADGNWQSEAIGRADNVTAREAKQARDTKARELGNRPALRNRPKRMTLAEFLEADRLAIVGDVRETTIIEHRHASTHVIAALGPEKELMKIGAAEVGRIKSHLMHPAPAKQENGESKPKRRHRPRTVKPKSPATIGKTLRAMRAAFNRAKKQGLVHDNPFADLRLPKVESKPKRIFTRAEVDAMVSNAGRDVPSDEQDAKPAFEPDLWWQAMIRLLATSGLRKDEALNLTWADVDLDGGSVTVQPKRAETIEVAGKTYATWDWNAKAKASYRTVPVPDETVGLLRKLRMLMGGSPFVFLTLQRLRQMQRHIDGGRLPAKFDVVPNMLRDFRAIQQRAAAKMNKGRQQPVKWPLGCLHDLRRTYCTWMANVVPMHVLKQWAGHADIATTCGFYLAVEDGMADRARKALAATALAG